jgi:hypothetical protein
MSLLYKLKSILNTITNFSNFFLYTINQSEINVVETNHYGINLFEKSPRDSRPEAGRAASGLESRSDL